MKTTIEISDALLIQAKQMAIQQGTTLRSLLERGLRQVVSEQPETGVFRLRNASFSGTGLQDGVRGAGWDRIREMAYEDHGG